MADKIIFGLHVAITVLGIILPFIAKRPILILYSLLVPFLFLHWVVNDDTCALTQIEMVLTGQEKHRTFMGRLMGPIYKTSDDIIDKCMKFGLFALWLFVQWRLGLIKELIKSK
jgi:hypothetical protein